MFLVLHAAQQVNADAKRQGKLAPFRIDKRASDGMRAWLGKMTDRESGRVGYITRGSRPARPNEVLARFPGERSEAMTAVGVFVRLLMGEDPRTNRLLKRGLALIAALPPTWNPASGDIDMYYWHWGTLAMHQAGGEQDVAWSAALARAVLDHQRHDGDACGAKGSWDPIGPWGPDGGRMYSTAFMALCLEAGDRYERVQPRKR